VIEPDLLMGYIGTSMVVRIGGGLSPSGFARYFAEWIRAIDARPENASVFAMYDIPDWPGMTAEQRKEWGEMLRSRERELRRTTRGMVLASPSRLTRGGAHALFWIAQPPYPHAVVDARSAGTRAIVGATPTSRMHVVRIEKSTSVAPDPTTSARPKRSARSSRGSYFTRAS
jgi:hypothetical protein